MSKPTSAQRRASAWWRPIRDLGEALRFLSSIPLPGSQPGSATSLAAAVKMFPLAGAIIGALLAGIGLAAGALWPDTARSVLLVVSWALLTAGLHLDGLSDTFDAVLSWRPRERKLEIMRDSRVGAMGVLSIVSIFALKVAWLAAAGESWLHAVWLAPILGRWASTYALVRFPSARGEGLGQHVQSQVRLSDLLISSATTVIPALLLAGVYGLVALICVWGGTHLLARSWARDLGGLTGDTYGALCEIAETIALAVLAAR